MPTPALSPVAGGEEVITAAVAGREEVVAAAVAGDEKGSR